MKLAEAVLVATCLLAGCSAPGRIDPDAIDELVQDVTNRHDHYVEGDGAYEDTDDPKYGQRETHLRSSALLRKVIEEAKAAKRREPPAVPSEDQK